MKKLHILTLRILLLLLAFTMLILLIPKQAQKDDYITGEINPGALNASYDKVMTGIDVSAWQATINWSQVKSAGVEFAMLRICSYSTSSKTYSVDSYFDSNIKGATANGIHIGAYFFSYANSLTEVANEANMIVNILNNYPATFSFPIVYDAESSNIQSFAADACVTFNTILEQNGYYSMIYANSNWFNNYILPSSKIANYALWQAHYRTAYAGYTPTDISGISGSRPALNANNSNVFIWQYTDSGSVTGISGNVDMNISYRDYSQIIPAMGYNKYHSHSYTSVHTDEQTHWYECSCGETTEPVNHEYTQTNDGTNHWQQCECGKTKDIVAHSYSVEANTTQHYNKCQTCNYIDQASVVDHSYALIDFNDTEHYNKCSCGTIDESSKLAHVGVLGNDETEHWEMCDCGYYIQEKTSHEYETLHFNENGHWTECECGTATTLISHNIITESNDETHFNGCSDCDYVDELTITNHIYLNATYDDTHHFNACSCGHKDATTIVEHNVVVHTNSTEHWKDCACGYVAEEATAHDYSITKGNSEGHWFLCSCGYSTNISSHVLDGTDCNECGYHVHDYEYTADSDTHIGQCLGCASTVSGVHQNENGKCTICNYNGSEIVPDDNNNNNDNNDNTGNPDNSGNNDDTTSKGGCNSALNSSDTLVTLITILALTAVIMIIKPLKKKLK